MNYFYNFLLGLNVLDKLLLQINELGKGPRLLALIVHLRRKGVLLVETLLLHLLELLELLVSVILVLAHPLH